MRGFSAAFDRPGLTRPQPDRNLGQHLAAFLALFAFGAPAPVPSREGAWLSGGFVRGRLHREGWGAEHGFPGLEWDPDGEPVPVDVFVSRELPDHWGRLDAFEGEDYRRTVAPVESLPDGPLSCHVCVIADRING